MTQVKLVKLKFKDEYKQDWLDWCEELKQRKDEIIKTLKHEGVLSEACFLSEDEKCVYYFMETENFAKANAAVEKSNFTIDAEHKEKRTLSLQKVSQLTELFHFENRP